MPARTFQFGWKPNPGPTKSSNETPNTQQPCTGRTEGERRRLSCQQVPIERMVNIKDLHKAHGNNTDSEANSDPMKIGRTRPKTHQTGPKAGGEGKKAQDQDGKPALEEDDDSDSVSSTGTEPHPGLGHLSSEFYEFLRYVFFLCLFCFVVFGSRNSDAYFIKETMDAFFFENDFDFETSFTDIGSMGQFWIFMNTTLLPNLYPTVNDGSGQTLSRRAKKFLADGTNFRLGLVRIRQIRMLPGLCSYDQLVEGCYPGWDTCLTDYSCQEDKADYNPGRLHAINSNSTRVWPWYSMKELGMPWYRSAATGTEYPGDGYIEDLGAPEQGYSFAPTPIPSVIPSFSFQPSALPTSAPSFDHTGPSRSPTFMPTTVETGDPRDEISWIAQQQVNTLRSLDWVDPATRVVFVDFNVYNPNTDMFGSVRMSVEFTGTGTVVPSYSVVSAQLMKPLRVFKHAVLGQKDGVSRYDVRSMYIEFFFYLFVLYYFLEEYRECMSARKALKKWKRAVAEGRIIVKHKAGEKEAYSWEEEDLLLEGREGEFGTNLNQEVGELFETGAARIESLSHSMKSGVTLSKDSMGGKGVKVLDDVVHKTADAVVHSKSVKAATSTVVAAEKKRANAANAIMKKSSTARTIGEGTTCLKRCIMEHVDHAPVDPDDRPVGYFEQGWNWIDMANLLLFLAVIVCRIWMMYQISLVDFSSEALSSRYFAEITDQIAFGKFIDQLNSINAILSFLKIFKCKYEQVPLSNLSP
jgi:hypothetical protein